MMERAAASGKPEIHLEVDPALAGLTVLEYLSVLWPERSSGGQFLL